MFLQFSIIDMLELAMVFLLSWAACALIIAHPGVRARVARRHEDITAPQAMHVVPTPRIGGIAIIGALIIGLAIERERIGYDLLAALAAGLLVFIAGIKEDIKRDVSPRVRLAVAFVSACAAVVLSNAMVRGLGLPEVDWLFGVVAVSLAVTLLWSAGLCHALNLIDGLNGLAASYAILAAMGLFVIAQSAGQGDIAVTCALLIAAIGGFLVLNWPLGKIFLGDAGAYAIGHVLAWLSIVLMTRASTVSGFAILLILFWPIADTAFTIIRRKLRDHPADAPDHLHSHHLMAHTLRALLGPNTPKYAVNSGATVALIPFLLAPIICGTLLWNRPAAALVALLVFSILFILSYVFTTDFLSRQRFQQAERADPRPQSPVAPQVIRSPLSGIFTKGSLAVDVQIEQQSSPGPWQLRTIADNAGGRVWSDGFETDRAAWDCFINAIEKEGMDVIVGPAVRRPVVHGGEIEGQGFGEVANQ